MRISIIVPVLNEAQLLVEFLRRLRTVAPGAEVIMVDGGSCDGSVELSRSLADHVIISPPGRGKQMNAGAALARGAVLWFVHADSQIPDDPLATMEESLQDVRMAGGCFGLRIVPKRWMYRIRDFVGDACVDLFRIGLGDRGLFCRREAFQAVGGYRESALFEDADLYRDLARAGKMRRLDLAIETSARRYEAQGPIRTCLWYGFIMLLYWGGLHRTLLERMVQRFCRRPHRIDQMHASTHLSRSDATERILPHSTPLQFNPNL